MQLQTLYCILFCAWTISGAGAVLMKCLLVGDPHILTFHRENEPTPPYKDCLNPGFLTVVRSPLVTFLADVTNWWMIELQLTFRAQPNTPAFCTVSSYNFVLSPDNGCSSNGVTTVLTDDGSWLTLSITYPAAEFSAVVSYYKYSWWQFYNIEVWMPENAATTALGVCTTPGCSGGIAGRKRSVRSVTNSVNNTSGLSNQTATQVCDVHIQNYLSSLPRNPSQYSVNYNGTIDRLREMCTFDVVKYGPEAATSVIQMLMIQEQTAGIHDNISQIQPAFQNNLRTVLTNAARMINESRADVNDLLNITTTQSPPTTSTISSSSSGSTTTSSNTPSTSSTTRSSSTSSVSTTIGRTHSSSSSTTTGSAPATVSSRSSTVTVSTNTQRSTTTIGILSAAVSIQAHKFCILLSIMTATMIFK